MTIGQALRAHLLTQSAVTALVVARVYPILAPEETALPMLTYDVGATAEGRTQTGSDGLALSPITVSCEATEHDAAVALRALVKAALEVTVEVWGVLAVYCVEATLGSVEWDEQTQSWVAALAVTVQHAKET